MKNRGTVNDPDDDFGWLAVSVETDAFTGRGGFWVQWQNVKELASKLDAYPLSSANPFVEEWGQSNGDGSNYEVIVGVSILLVNKTSDLDVVVRIAHHHDTIRDGNVRPCSERIIPTWRTSQSS